jgi:integrase
MQTGYEKETVIVISHLEQVGYHPETIADYRRCYNGLKAHLAAIGLPFSMKVALEWLEGREQNWTHSTYKKYRHALFHLERYLLNGNVDRTRCSGIDQFFCRDATLFLPRLMFDLFGEIKSILNSELTEDNANCYLQGCKDFLLFVTDQGCLAPADIALEQITEYSTRFRGTSRKLSYKEACCLAGITKMLTHLAERGDIPRCYSKAVYKDKATTFLSSVIPDIIGSAIQPSKKLEPLAAEFLSGLGEQRYSDLVKKKNMHDLTNCFLFIEINHPEYSPQSIELWLGTSPQNAIWERKRHTLTLFADYLSTGSMRKESCYTWQPLQIDSLPDRSRNIVTGFVSERQREGFAYTTLKLCRLAGCRFFSFLDSKGVCEPRGITPELVKEFHNTDKHSTAMGKNAYGTKVRQLLAYMDGHNLVPQNLFLAVSTQCAPCPNIVNVMSEEMEAAIYKYRSRATTPLELRNIAIIMLGLRMGLRASDIVNLKTGDFRWHNRTVAFVQKKTGKPITIPIPADVGNSVHKYIMEGRPQSGTQGDGYVFVRHRAPYGGMKTVQACRYALTNVLSAYGMKLPFGEGFHITRKTFATRLLTSKNSFDDISNALGHAAPKSAEAYLARDEEGMRLCPLPFESAGVPRHAELSSNDKIF